MQRYIRCTKLANVTHVKEMRENPFNHSCLLIEIDIKDMDVFY